MEVNPTSFLMRAAAARESNTERATYELLSNGFTTPVPLLSRPSCLQQEEVVTFTRDAQQTRRHAFAPTECTWELNYEAVTKFRMDQSFGAGRAESLSCSSDNGWQRSLTHAGSHPFSSSLSFQPPPLRAAVFDCRSESDIMGPCSGPPNKNPFSTSTFQGKLAIDAYDRSGGHPTASFHSPAVHQTSLNLPHLEIQHAAVAESQQSGFWHGYYQPQPSVPASSVASYNVYCTRVAPVVDSYNQCKDSEQSFTTGGGASSVTQRNQFLERSFGESLSASACHHQFFDQHAPCFYSGDPESACSSSPPSSSSSAFFHDASGISLSGNPTPNPLHSSAVISDIVSTRASSVVASTRPATNSSTPTARTSRSYRQSTTNNSPSSSSAPPAKPPHRRRRPLRVTACSPNSDTWQSAGRVLPQFCEEYVTEHGCLYPGTPNAPATMSSTHDEVVVTPGKGPRVYLSNYRLWRRFHAKETEMLFNKQGRAMFPILEYKVTGLRPWKQYACIVDMVPANGEHTLMYHSNKWLLRSANSAAPKRKYLQLIEQSSPCSVLLPSLNNETFLVEDGKIIGLHIADCVFNRLYVHPDCPKPGDYWMGRTIVFNKLKLTNNCNDSNGHIVLKSHVQYQPRFHILEMKPWGIGVERAVVSAVFPETQFITVTSYQNPDISDLKILLNPFAKSIRRTLCAQSDDGCAGTESTRGDGKVTKAWPSRLYDGNPFHAGSDVGRSSVDLANFQPPGAATIPVPCAPITCVDNGPRATWHMPLAARQLPDSRPARANQLGMPEQTVAIQEQNGDGNGPTCVGLGGGAAHAAHVQRDVLSPRSFSYNDSDGSGQQHDGHQGHDNTTLFPQQPCGSYQQQPCGSYQQQPCESYQQQPCESYQHQPCWSYQQQHPERTELQAGFHAQQAGLVPVKRARHLEDSTLMCLDCYPGSAKVQRTSQSSPETCISSSSNLIL